ncbi:MAG: glutamine-hydrolyzing carbamoyl-phosphate synthase small subunit [Euryarchaeota archaeon]|nr:glutamine-hydrolyzing carbamoyl-phosphate synthase small subunit [Euryarchaeota archaeon]
MTSHGGFSPGEGQSGVFNPFCGIDAADILLSGDIVGSKRASGKGVILLADGSRFEGDLFGAEAIGEGELVFTTGMTGFQESLSDPSFAGQVLTFTWPLLGNYGVAEGISESSGVWPRGVVCREWIDHPDHRDCIGSVDDFLLAHGVPGITSVDTRALTRRVREHGVILCQFGPLEMEEEMRSRLEKMTSPDLEDLVDEVSRDDAVLLNEGVLDANGIPKPRIAALDCGIKYNILRQLSNRFEVLWCPPDVGYDTLVSDWQIDALFCSNGPGDPAHGGKAMAARRALATGLEENMPVMGICLGHQLLGLATGLETYKLRYGHRGANQPVVDLISSKVSITSQNHGFAVNPRGEEPLAPHPIWQSQGAPVALSEAETTVRFVNANDRTVEGLDVVGRPAFSVQYHPEACPGPHDADYLFDRFSEIVAKEMDGKLPLSKRGGA